MKILSKIFIAISIFASASCSKSFLDKEPLAVLSTATFSSDTTTLGLAVNRLYGSLAWREFTLGRQWYATHELCGDDYMSGAYAALNVYQNYAFFATDGFIQQYWDRTYQNIHYCNVVLDRTPTYSARASAVLYEAQAKYFRGWYNFDLTNVFGDAPLRDHDPVSDAEINIPKSTHADIIKLVISDLQYASAHLPTRAQWGTAGLGHVTKGTAQGLLAKVYLYEQDYKNAKLYADSVILGGEYSLLSNYRSVFSPDQLYSVENMMPGGYIFNSTISSGRWYNPYLQYQGLPSLGSDGDVYPTNTLASSYETGDPRFTASLFTTTDTVVGYNNNKPVAFPAGISYTDKKVIWPFSYWNNGNFSFQNVNPMFLRFADIVLVDAEASNELGNTSDALKYLEQIRARARQGAAAGVLPQITTTVKSALRLAIWRERHIELAMEFNRWFDLVRYNKVANADGTEGSGYTEALLKTTLGRTAFNYAKFSHFPLPATYVTSSNGVLVQNPNW